MKTTNNVTRLLESRHLPFEVLILPELKLGAVQTAAYLGVSPSMVYKTIVVTRPPKKPLLCVIPGDREVDLKSVAMFCGEKKVILPTQNEAEKLTGLQAGGISPLALLHRGFETIIDESALALERFHISGGQRGLNIKMNPLDLAQLMNARFARVVNESRTP